MSILHTLAPVRVVGRDESDDKSDDFDSFTECGRTACECRRRVTCAMDDAWWKSSRHGMSQETSRVGSLPPARPEAVGSGRVGRDLGAPIPISVKGAVSSANNASWTPDDDGRGISFVYAVQQRERGGALRNSCSDKTSCRTCVPYPIEGLGYIKETATVLRSVSKPSETYSTKRRFVWTRMGWAKAELFIYDKAFP
ncbi:hypothetical protein EVAR_79936_1 [Eumeta japonica]|uniref:Uncharacterized protein n=1 Tax=Eumeta variegata TaxID=151549 RepID=A0A4C1Y2Y3_EUMVA|nr:hypothetical protein EVAR_79936_1 [Eumeta japonica]